MKNLKIKKLLPLILTLIVSFFLLLIDSSHVSDSSENSENPDSSTTLETDLPIENNFQELIFTAKIVSITEKPAVSINYIEPKDSSDNLDSLNENEISGQNFDPDQFNSEILELKLEIIKEPENVLDFFAESQIGETITIDQDPNYLAGKFDFQENDKLLINYLTGTESYQIIDYVRTPTLFWLLLIFIVIVITVTKWQGIGSLIGMAFSFLVLFKLILPKILAGGDPVTSVIFGAILIIPATFFLSHGVNRKTSTAVLGTLFTLIFTGFLAKIFANFANLSGLTSEEASFLSLETAQNINFKSLVLAGMIVGIIGILDDITISQSSVVQQLKNTKKSISGKELFKRAMAVGKDHISSMVNTLILIYAGASLPLLLLFLDYNEGFSEVINQEFMSQEIIETLVGSIGLILAVPFTTFLAIFLIKENPHDKHAGCRH